MPGGTFRKRFVVTTPGNLFIIRYIMENINYVEKLRSPEWQKKRLEIMLRDNFKCKCCYSTDIELNVHHFDYSKNPWESEDYELITLCKNCHNVFHKIFDEFKLGIVLHLSELYFDYAKKRIKTNKEEDHGWMDKII